MPPADPPSDSGSITEPSDDNVVGGFSVVIQFLGGLINKSKSVVKSGIRLIGREKVVNFIVRRLGGTR